LPSAVKDEARRATKKGIRENRARRKRKGASADGKKVSTISKATQAGDCPPPPFLGMVTAVNDY
jgi:hypothetical protein